MTRSERLTAGVFGALFIALHLPFLPPSLEDLDSINFALGIRSYDISLHQPHPPGYPIFILAAKLLHAAGLSEVHALSLLGVLAGGLGVVGMMALFAAMDRGRRSSPFTALAVVAVAVSPLFWFTAARPLSDMMGLGVSLAVQAAIVTAASVGGLAAAAFLAALAAGIRSQVVWLTLPLLVLAWIRLPRSARGRGALWMTSAYVAGGLVWAIPLLVISGGPSAYLSVFYNQGAEDLTGVAMLATTPTLRQAVLAFQMHFVAPWGEWPVAAVALVLAAVGLLHMAWSDRRGLLTLAAAFVPYIAFDLLFQETITTRYALPVVVPVGYLAVRGASLAPRPVGAALAVALIAAGAWISDQAMYGFSTMEAPVFRMIGDMNAAAHHDGAVMPTTPVLAMHRREYFDLRRPFQWAGDRVPAFAQRLSTPPKHEWLEVVKYWNGGGLEPVWFVADPLRSDLALLGHVNRPVRYRWPFAQKALVGGARPNELDWHQIESPDWYLGEGWALTPETAGTAREDGKGPGASPIEGWIRRRPGPMTVMIGGRNLSASGTPARVRVALDGAEVFDETMPPGFFLRMIDIASSAGPGRYARLTVSSDRPEVAIEQFDAEPTDQLLYGFGDGWNEQEYNPSTGVLWRWSSDRSVIRLRPGGHGAALTLRGEIEEASTSHVTVRLGDSVVAAFDVGRSFEKTVIIPAAQLSAPEVSLVIEASHYYVPADTRWRSGDRRRLGLKLVECSLAPVGGSPS